MGILKSSERDEQFCPYCEISTDLHSGIGEDIEEWECEAAAQKVEIMNRFFGDFSR